MKGTNETPFAYSATADFSRLFILLHYVVDCPVEGVRWRSKDSIIDLNQNSDLLNKSKGERERENSQSMRMNLDQEG